MRLLIAAALIVFLAGAWVTLGSISALQTKAPTASPADFFPMKKGTTWDYQANVTWTVSGTSEVIKREMAWKMEVVEHIAAHGKEAAFLLGHPQDLAWFEEGRERGSWAIFRDGGKYYLLRKERAEVLRKWMNVADHGPAFTPIGDEMFLSFPLEKYARFGDEEMLKRDDSFYAWFVQEVREADLRGIKGLKAEPKTREEFELVLRTLPEHFFVTVVPTVGITHFIYGHHGTPSDVDAKLVAFTLGR